MPYCVNNSLGPDYHIHIYISVDYVFFAVNRPGNVFTSWTYNSATLLYEIYYAPNVSTAPTSIYATSTFMNVRVVSQPYKDKIYFYDFTINRLSSIGLAISLLVGDL